MHQPESTLALTLQWPASTFRGNKQREILKSSNGMKTFDLQAFALHGSRCMLTHFSHFSGANIATKHLQPTSIDDAAWIPGQRSGLADMLAHWTQKQRAHPRGTCERVRPRCRRLSSFLPRQLQQDYLLHLAKNFFDMFDNSQLTRTLPTSTALFPFYPVVFTYDIYFPPPPLLVLSTRTP